MSKFQGHTVLFSDPQDAGAGAVNIKVELKVDMPTVRNGQIVLQAQNILTFHANIRKSNEMKERVVRQGIREDWQETGYGAVDVARRWMINP